MFEHRHFWASSCNYIVWNWVIRESWSLPMNPKWKDWDMKEKDIEYDKMTSLRELKERVEPHEQPSFRRKGPPQRTGHASRHEQPKSHSACQVYMRDVKCKWLSPLNAVIMTRPSKTHLFCLRSHLIPSFINRQREKENGTWSLRPNTKTDSTRRISTA